MLMLLWSWGSVVILTKLKSKQNLDNSQANFDKFDFLYLSLIQKLWGILQIFFYQTKKLGPLPTKVTHFKLSTLVG